MPRRTHPGRRRARRNFAKLEARRDARPAGPGRRTKPRPIRCEECWRTEQVEEYGATPLVESSRRPDKPRTILLCRICLLERSASWRWRFKISGRALPDQDRRAA